MSNAILGIVIGGIAPAILYGVSGLFSKSSTNAGIGIGIYLLIIGLAVLFVGVGFFIALPDRTLSVRSGLHAAGFGITWALGSGLVAIALSQFGAPIGKLVPLYNMNTLIVVLLGLWLFSEWKQVDMTQLLIGTMFIIVGGTLVARA